MKAIKKPEPVGNCRVSDESQIEAHSLDAQRTEIQRWCQQRGYLLDHIYVEGKSSLSNL